MAAALKKHADYTVKCHSLEQSAITNTAGFSGRNGEIQRCRVEIDFVGIAVYAITKGEIDDYIVNAQTGGYQIGHYLEIFLSRQNLGFGFGKSASTAVKDDKFPG